MNKEGLRLFLLNEIKAKQSVDESLNAIQLCKIHRKLYRGRGIKVFAYPTMDEALKYAQESYNKIHKKKGDKRVDYYIYIKSKEWKKKVAWIHKIRKGKCEICGARKKLDVHHLTYKNLGNEKEEDLQLLCRVHHKQAHDIKTGRNRNKEDRNKS